MARARGGAKASTGAGKGALRVVAGDLRGRRFDAPPGAATRPTSDRVREAVFNALESLDAIDGASVLDAFAGSGALGIEALSRGAARATMADTDPAALAVLEANVAMLGLGDRVTVLRGAVERALGPGRHFGLVLLDPPYAFVAWDDLLGRVAAALEPGGMVVTESDRELAMPAALRGIRSKTYGGTVVQFATRAGAPT